MKMKFQSPGLLVVLVLLLHCVTRLNGVKNEGPPPTVKPRYEKFHRQHIYGNMNEHECNKQITAREIYELDERTCKETNSFITTSVHEVRKVCNDAGIREGNLYRSTKPFPVITCKLKNQDKHQPRKKPNCDYKGKKSTNYIRIACDEGWPVHYDGDIVVINN